MTEAEVLEAFTDICRTVLDDDAIELSDSTVADEIEGWDSITHVEILVSIEEQFGVRFSTGEASAMKNVGDLVRTIRHKMG